LLLRWLSVLAVRNSDRQRRQRLYWLRRLIQLYEPKELRSKRKLRPQRFNPLCELYLNVRGRDLRSGEVLRLLKTTVLLRVLEEELRLVRVDELPLRLVGVLPKRQRLRVASCWHSFKARKEHT
jgi:hypothetical protein